MARLTLCININGTLLTEIVAVDNCNEIEVR